MKDVAFVLGCALVATFAIVAWHDSALSMAVMLLVLASLLARFHDRRDLVGLAVGATLGNLTELVCERGGVWVHASKPVLGTGPFYIWVCYPILGVAVPRLIDAVVGASDRLVPGSARGDSMEPRASRAEAGGALVVWSAHTGASFFLGTRNIAELVVSVACLFALFTLARSSRDVATALVGALLGLVWEIPCTLSGAWSFPSPQVFGLVPAWLPFAYAVFFTCLGRITTGSIELVTPLGRAPVAQAARRPRV
jgi:hypothetical protein